MKINVEKISLKDTCRICVISDIHHIKTCNNKYYDNIFKQIESLKPKYILIPGDIVDSPQIIKTIFISPLILFLKKLASIAVVIISKGNHEQKKSKTHIKSFYKKISVIKNIYVLDNNSITFNDYHFIGFCSSLNTHLKKYKKTWNKEFLKEFKKANLKYSDKKTIMLLHSPEIILNEEVYKQLPLEKVDYIICGHMHNGLVPKSFEKLFGNFGLCGPNYSFLPKYCRGIHKINKTQVIICKSLRVLTKDKFLYRALDKLYQRNITIIDI